MRSRAGQPPPAGWERIAGGTHCPSGIRVYLHRASGWEVRHLGDRRGSHPYAVFTDAGIRLAGPDGLGWRKAREAMAYAEQRFRDRLPLPVESEPVATRMAPLPRKRPRRLTRIERAIVRQQIAEGRTRKQVAQAWQIVRSTVARIVGEVSQ